MRFFKTIGWSTGLVMTGFLPFGKLVAGEAGIWQLRPHSISSLSDIIPKHQNLLNELSGFSDPLPQSQINYAIADKCLLSVLPDDTEHLKLTLANAPENCTLELRGTYELNGPLHVNRPLKASAPVSDQQATGWFLPDRLIDSQSAIQIGCATDNGQALCPGEKTHYSPTAVIIIRQGGIRFAAEGGLQQIGIIDARIWPDNELPALVSESVSPASLSFNHVFFKGQYPWISDMDDNHPYWNNNELADTVGGARAATARLVRWFGSSGAGRSRFGAPGQRRFSGSSSGGDGWHPPKKTTELTRSHYNEQSDMEENLRIFEKGVYQGMGTLLGAGLMIGAGMALMHLVHHSLEYYHDLKERARCRRTLRENAEFMRQRQQKWDEASKAPDPYD